MFCLLCHAKIPRLRAWRTKSEFCCDDHAAVYKKQTLERLLTDQSESTSAPPLPLGDTPEQGFGVGDAFLLSAAPEPRPPDALERLREAGAAPAADTTAFTVPQRPEPLVSGGEAEAPAWRHAESEAEPAQATPEDSEEEFPELWRLAEGVAQPDAPASPDDVPAAYSDDWAQESGATEVPAPKRDVTNQSPEEALAALQRLTRGARTKVQQSEPVEALDRLSGVPLEPSRDDRLTVPGESRSLPDEGAGEEYGSASGISWRDEDGPQGLYTSEEEEDEALPSILERLTEVPLPKQRPAPLTEHGIEALGQDESSALEPGEVVFADAVEGDEPVATQESSEPPAPAEWAEPGADTEAGLSGIADPLVDEVFEEAVESHLESRPDAPQPAGPFSPKVVPFPGPDAAREIKSKKRKPESSPEKSADHAAAPEEPKPGITEQVSASAGKAVGGRLNLKPTMMICGLEPSPWEPGQTAGGAGEQADFEAEWAASIRAGVNGLVAAELPLVYPFNGEPLSVEASPRPQAGLRFVSPTLPEAPRAEPLRLDLDLGDFEGACGHPAPLHLRNGFAAGRTRGIGDLFAALIPALPYLVDLSDSELEAPGYDSLEPSLPPRMPAGLSAEGGTGGPAIGWRGVLVPVDRARMIYPDPREPEGEFDLAAYEQKLGLLAGSVLDPSFEPGGPAG